MKHRYCLGLATLLFLLVLSTTGTYAINESFDVVADNAPGFYELTFLEKDNSYVDMTIEVLNVELDNCSLFVIDNEQRDQLEAIWDYIAAHQVYPWAELTPPTGTHTATGLLYADLEPVEIYFGAYNLTEGETRQATGYLGSLSFDEIQLTTDTYFTNITYTNTVHHDLRYYIVLECMSVILTYNPENPLYPRILGFSYYDARVHVTFVTTLPAPSALLAIVVLVPISFVIYRKRKK